MDRQFLNLASLYVLSDHGLHRTVLWESLRRYRADVPSPAGKHKVLSVAHISYVIMSPKTAVPGQIFAFNISQCLSVR